MTAELLLADPSPALRLRVLTELLDAPAADPEVRDLTARRRHMPQVETLLKTDPRDLRQLCWALCRLGFLGLDRTDRRVAALAEHAFERQSRGGSWPIMAFYRGTGESRYSMIPLQASIPLRALASVGYALDPRCERGYEWLLDQRMDDGAWPLGIASGQPGYIAGYRRLPGSKGCRVNTEAALAALALHPARSTSDAARRGLDLLLQRETRDEWALGTEVARLTATDEVPGFVTSYARFDLAFVLELASRIGASGDDPRVADLVAFLERLRGSAGLWQHPERPDLSRWLTFQILDSIRRIEAGDWVGGAPRMPFRATRMSGSR
ncbi:MAG TPA: hypothetical protein VFW95_03745 [Candidatus Limnocylindria bacterium]|nr:hypothetical protein [Candidatus Limnocylindria bacterium]